MTTSPPHRPPLDKSQESFCIEPLHAIRLLAPAGSGKTHSLLWRCLLLAQRAGDKERPRSIVFTFTRAAGEELRDRLANDPRFAPIRSHVEITTLNAWGFRWLKSRLSNPRLITAGQERFFCMTNLLQPVWQQHPKLRTVLSDNRRKTRAARALMDLSDQLKSLGFRHDTHTAEAAFITHCDWLATNGMSLHLASVLRQLKDLEIIQEDIDILQMFATYFPFWCQACETMYRSALLSFEDQKYWALVELEKIAAKAPSPRRYQHILVDEFQDINPLDLALLKVIAAWNRTMLTIVGDDDQAIYEWRGATPEFILQPQQHIGSEYKTYTLEVNYRSPRNIVDLSQRLIRHNKRRVDKSVRSASPRDARIDVVMRPSLEASMEYVQQLVMDSLRDSEIQKIALIGRKRSQIIPYQIVFAGAEIPFYAAEDLHVLLSDAFNELKAMLLLKAQACTPLPFGPDPIEGLLKLCDKVKRYPLSKNDRGELKKFLVRTSPRTVREAATALYTYRGPLKGENHNGEMAGKFFMAIGQLLAATTVADAIHAISEQFEGLQKDYGKSLDDIFYADPPFLYLGEYAKRYGDDYARFYQDVEKAIATLARTLPDEDEGEEQPEAAWKRPVHLMTALRAKGKEFDVVVLLDCNAGIWPSKLALTEAELEAERRLFYVAFTRARKRVALVVDQSLRGEQLAPSPYLTELGLQV